MLHEILLSLSGHPSPLFDGAKDRGANGQDSFPLVSPAEAALLQSLGNLSQLHRDVRDYCSVISSSHSSTICRAVATTIASVLLGGFQQKILNVEQSVLLKDAEYVGGYDIVPLSTIVSEFSPWNRRLEWLWEVVQIVQPEGTAQDKRRTSTLRSCSGASIIDHLRSEMQTGYRDIEEMASILVKSAEVAWMRQLSTWILYGKLPAFGAEDFFIKEETEARMRDEDETIFSMHTRLLPRFVSPSTASSVVFVGRTLNHIRSKKLVSATKTGSVAPPELALLSLHLQKLSALSFPIASIELASAVSAIRLSLSQRTLSQILPLSRIVEVLSLLHSFLLLENGEFAMLLIEQADKSIRERQRQGPQSTHVQALGNISVRDGEVAAVLSQTLSELFALRNGDYDDLADEELDLARELLRLSVTKPKQSRPPTPGREADEEATEIKLADTAFDDLLFPNSTTLSITRRAPLDLFLSSKDLSIYSSIHAYLLGIRRAHVHLSSLWKHSSLRRTYPTPWGPPLSNSKHGSRRLEQGRQRENDRTKSMRPIWAASTSAMFLLAELGGYIQGEVVKGAWEHFRCWLNPEESYDTATDAPNHDPETLGIAHRAYLRSISQAMFLADKVFTERLRSFLNNVDYLVALITRLQTVQQNLDLETDEGVVDTFANYAQEEADIMSDLHEARSALQAGVLDVVERLREIDEHRLGGSRAMDQYTMRDSKTYVPRKGSGVDQLLLKLEFGTGVPQRGEIESDEDGEEM